MVNFPSRAPKSKLGPVAGPEVMGGQLKKTMKEAREMLEALNIAQYFGGRIGEGITDQDAEAITSADYRLGEYGQRIESLSSAEQDDLRVINDRLKAMQQRYTEQIERAQRVYNRSETISVPELEMVFVKSRKYLSDLQDAGNFVGLMSKEEKDGLQDAAEKLREMGSKAERGTLLSRSIKLLFQVGLYLERLHRKYQKEIAEAKGLFEEPGA